VTLDATPINKLKVEDVVTRLKNKEARQVQRYDPLLVDVAHLAFNQQKPGQWMGSSDGAGPRCFNCNGNGHIAKVCPSPKRKADDKAVAFRLGKMNVKQALIAIFEDLTKIKNSQPLADNDDENAELSA
jgi:hypothetical protein